MPEPSTEAIDSFIAKWSRSGGHERGSGQYFLLDLCDLLGLEKPAAPVPENELNAYTFERRVDRRKPDGSSAPNWIDLYKSGYFVLETKQGVNARRDKSDPDQPLLPALDAPSVAKSAGHGQRGSATWDKALERAHKQAERYIHLLPVDEGRPPFLIVCDVGHCFDLYAEFSGTGGQYEAFPDPRSRRILLKDFHQQETRDLFRKIWHDPRSLDPSKHAAAVTREVAKALADLAKSLEKDGHDPQVTAGFLQRCLFTMFAEDIGLLPQNSFAELLLIAKNAPAGFPVLLQGLWADMATGCAFSAAIRAAIPHFNGGLFKDTAALPLRPDQIVYLLHAANQDWAAVEPAIFGTLLERALDPRERHKLGAHYTPRSYVERLVRPTLIEPLREKWEAVKAAAAQLDDNGKAKDARAAVEKFHHELAAIRVLDPACGSGNFLYVSLELLKRLEAEVLDLFENLGGDRRLEMDTAIIRPGNFLGIELNPRAAAIAQLVLWIGYFQWHKRTTGKADTNDRPLLPKHNTIECRDAVLAYDERIPRRDESGEIVTTWDGRTTKPHPVTGKEVPDESARSVLFDYVNPRRAEWPKADFIVGNPPFIGNKRMRDGLGDGYVEALRLAWKKCDPSAWDLVMFWWYRAAEMLVDGHTERFGFITTNSIHLTFNRRVLERFLTHPKQPIHLKFAIPDHPWVDAADGADVRIAMTVCATGVGEGVFATITNESQISNFEESILLSENFGTITPSLRIGANPQNCSPLSANSGIAFTGMYPLGQGFVLSRNEVISLGYDARNLPGVLKPFRIARDLTQRNRDSIIIDFYPLDQDQACAQHPMLFQYLLNHVKPEREQNPVEERRRNWWLFTRPVPDLRVALSTLDRAIFVPRTAKHFTFQFVSPNTVPDTSVVAIAMSDACALGILSSSVHLLWAVQSGGRLGVGNDPRYQHNQTFKLFSFPAVEEGPLKQRIRDLGERLDAHRKERQAAHPDLTLTGMYNVLEKLRRGEALNDKEKKIHDSGLVTLLKQLHDELDAAVLEAYGWSDLIPAANISLADRLARGDDAADALEQDLLGRLVALNHERAAEEKRGLVRWLRPAYQAPGSGEETKPLKQSEIDLPGDDPISTESVPAVVLDWPNDLPAQVAAVRKLLPSVGQDPGAIAACFGRKTKKRIDQIAGILVTLKELGHLV